MVEFNQIRERSLSAQRKKTCDHLIITSYYLIDTKDLPQNPSRSRNVYIQPNIRRWYYHCREIVHLKDNACGQHSRVLRNADLGIDSSHVDAKNQNISDDFRLIHAKYSFHFGMDLKSVSIIIINDFLENFS